MCWPSGVTATAFTQLVCSSSKRGRACRRRGTAGPLGKDRPQSARRRAAPRRTTFSPRTCARACRASTASRCRPRDADEARSARQHRHRLDVLCADGVLARRRTPHLDGLVPRAGDDAAVGRRRNARHLSGAQAHAEVRLLGGKRSVAERARQVRTTPLICGRARGRLYEAEDLGGQPSGQLGEQCCGSTAARAPPPRPNPPVSTAKAWRNAHGQPGDARRGHR